MMLVAAPVAAPVVVLDFPNHKSLDLCSHNVIIVMRLPAVVSPSSMR
jgi:hypothetical protein